MSISPLPRTHRNKLTSCTLFHHFINAILYLISVLTALVITSTSIVQLYCNTPKCLCELRNVLQYEMNCSTIKEKVIYNNYISVFLLCF